MSPSTPAEAARGRWLLLTGAALGIALAIAGILAPHDGSQPLGADQVARVNGEPIARDDFLRALARIEADKRNPPQAGERAHVLQRLIDDELLVQRGVALGLIESDPAVRKALASAVIASVVAEASSAAPSETELEEFFAENAAYFARTSRARVTRIFVRDGPDADARIATALASLEAGVAPDVVAARDGDATALVLPDVLLPEAKLRELLGPTQADVALALAPGTYSEPLAGDGGRTIWVSLGRETAEPPLIEDVRPQVEAEWSRREGERALARYLQRLREGAAIERADDVAP